MTIHPASLIVVTGTSYYRSTGDHKSSRTWLFAGVTFFLGAYFLIELRANLTTPPGSGTAEIWSKVWWITGLFPTILWYRLMTLLVKDRYDDSPFWLRFHNKLWLLYLIMAEIFLITGMAHIDWYHDAFLEAGPYYGYFAIYVLSSLIMAAVVLIHSHYKRKRTRKVGQGDSLTFFFIGNCCAIVSVMWMAGGVYEGKKGVAWIDSIFNANFSGDEISQGPGELLLLALKICMIYGITRSNRILDRRSLKHDWWLKLLVMDFASAVAVIVLVGVKWKADYLPLVIFPLLTSIVIYSFLLFIHHRTIIQLVRNLEGFPSGNAEIMGLFKIDEEECQRRVKAIFDHLADLLQLERAALIPAESGDQKYSTHLYYRRPGSRALPEELYPENRTRKIEYDLLRLDVGKPVTGELILGPKKHKQDFTQEEVSLAQHGVDLINDLWSMRSIIARYNTFVEREVNRRDELVSEQIHILHAGLIGELDALTKRLEICREWTLYQIRLSSVH